MIPGSRISREANPDDAAPAFDIGLHNTSTPVHLATICQAEKPQRDYLQRKQDGAQVVGVLLQ